MIVKVYLRSISEHNWALFAEKGHQISQEFKGDLRLAKMQAEVWISSWTNWEVVVDESD